jgi:hypothetical protein
LFVRQDGNVREMTCSPDYFKDASIDEKNMYMQRFKKWHCQFASAAVAALHLPQPLQ